MEDSTPPPPEVYLEVVRLALQPLVLAQQVAQAPFGLAQLRLQLGLQLLAALLELLQLLPGLAAAARKHTRALTHTLVVPRRANEIILEGFPSAKWGWATLAAIIEPPFH